MNEILIGIAVQLSAVVILSITAFLTGIFKLPARMDRVEHDIVQIKTEIKEFKAETRENFRDIRNILNSMQLQITNISISLANRYNHDFKEQ